MLTVCHGVHHRGRSCHVGAAFVACGLRVGVWWHVHVCVHARAKALATLAVTTDALIAPIL